MHTFLALGPSQGPPRVHECKVSTQCAWLVEGGNASHARIWPKPHWPELVFSVFWPCVCVCVCVLCVCAAGLAHDNLRTPNVHISAPDFNTTKIPRPPRVRRKNEISGVREEKTRNFWASNPSGPQPFGPPPFRAPTTDPPTNRPTHHHQTKILQMLSGRIRSNKIGHIRQVRLAKCGQLSLAPKARLCARGFQVPFCTTLAHNISDFHV